MLRHSVALLITIGCTTPALASRPDLDGKWVAPGGNRLAIAPAKGKSDSKRAVKVTARIKRHKHTVTLRFAGETAYVKVGADGGLGLTASGRPFAIRWQGRRCTVKKPRISVIGELDASGEHIYDASGTLHGKIFCRGKDTQQLWVVDLTGTWK